MKCAVGVFSQYLGLASVSKILYQRPLSAEDLLVPGVATYCAELLKEAGNIIAKMQEEKEANNERK